MPTTIQITEKTKHKLDRLKDYSRETYDDVVNKMIELAIEDNLDFSKETKEGIKRAREDIRKGRVYSTKELISELGI